MTASQASPSIVFITATLGAPAILRSSSEGWSSGLAAAAASLLGLARWRHPVHEDEQG